MSGVKQLRKELYVLRPAGFFPSRLSWPGVFDSLVAAVSVRYQYRQETFHKRETLSAYDKGPWNRCGTSQSVVMHSAGRWDYCSKVSLTTSNLFWKLTPLSAALTATKGWIVDKVQSA